MAGIELPQSHLFCQRKLYAKSIASKVAAQTREITKVKDTAGRCGNFDAWPKVLVTEHLSPVKL
jgi:hypothetical protein